MNKQEAREYYLSVRNSISEAERQSKSAVITDKVIGSTEYADCRMLLVYVSTGSEADTRELIGKALSDGKITAVPYCIGKEMKFRVIDSLLPLVAGRFGILTADDSCPFADSFENALCIVPALSLDKNGNRLGYGGGYYDRFLSENPDIKTLALCFEDCLSDGLPSESTDIKIDEIITENRILGVK